MSPRRKGGFATAGLFVAIFAFYMLTTSRERPWSDATLIWQLGEALTRGEISVSVSWPPDLPRGKDGKVYAAAPLLQGLTQMPAAGVHRAMAALWPQTHDLAWKFLSHLSPAALAAWAAVLLFRALRRLGISWPAATLTTLTTAGATTLWVYSRYPYAEALQAACFMGLLAQTIAMRVAPDRRGALLLGLWAGLLVNAKISYLVLLPPLALFVGWPLRRRPRELLTLSLWALVALVPLFFVMGLYNHARWGSFLNAGYNAKRTPQENLFFGLWGLLFSPGKSVFLFSPPLLLSLMGLPRLHRRWPQVTGALACLVIPMVLLNATLLFWGGDYAWGPRYLAPLVPALMLPAALWFEDLVTQAPSWRRRLRWALTGGVLALGVFIQVLGSAFHWDHFTRLQRDVRNQWLGIPNTSGTPFPDFSGVCGACFEDMHGLQWLPPLNPIEGHWWLLRHVVRGHGWERAEADAPWRRYTSLRLNLANTYPAARIDWWPLEYTGRNRIAGVFLGLGLTLALVIGAAAFWRGREGAQPPTENTTQ